MADPTAPPDPLPPTLATRLLAPDAAAAPPPPTSDEWRNHLIAAEQKSQEDLDKALLSLSGGALGVSFIFLKDVIGPGELHAVLALIGAWMSWALSTLMVLGSYYGSVRTIHRAIFRYDQSLPADRGLELLAGLTNWLNAFAGILFVAGVVLMTVFVVCNFDGKGLRHGNSSSPAATSSAASQSTAGRTDANAGQPSATGLRPASAASAAQGVSGSK